MCWQRSQINPAQDPVGVTLTTEFMMQKTILGLILVVVGIGLLYWGYSESQSVSSQVTEAFSGSPQDKVMYKYIGGAVALIVGIYLAVRKA